MGVSPYRPWTSLTLIAFSILGMSLIFFGSFLWPSRPSLGRSLVDSFFGLPFSDAIFFCTFPWFALHNMLFPFDLSCSCQGRGKSPSLDPPKPAGLFRTSASSPKRQCPLVGSRPPAFRFLFPARGIRSIKNGGEGGNRTLPWKRQIRRVFPGLGLL